MGDKLPLCTHKKSHMGFHLVPKLMTLNDFEWQNGCYFALLHQIQ